MTPNGIDVTRLTRIFQDRILIRKRGEPEKKRGIFIPMSVRPKKEPKKIWWGNIVKFGEDSYAEENLGLSVGDMVGIEPIGHHYAGWKGADDFEYAWVPDEHIALKDAGSAEDHYQDKLDRKSEPRLIVIGSRVLARPSNTDDMVNGIVRPKDEEREADLADVIIAGPKAVVGVGERVLHVVTDAGSSAIVDIFDPSLLILRSEDIIAVYDKEPAKVMEAASV